MKHFIMLVTICLTFFACSPSVSFMTYDENTYPATQSVKVIRNKPVEKEFVELGELSLRIKKGVFSNQEDAVLQLKEKAKEIGADAIIILGEESEGKVTVPIGNLYTSIDKRYLRAIAIKYKRR